MYDLYMYDPYVPICMTAAPVRAQALDRERQQQGAICGAGAIADADTRRAVPGRYLVVGVYVCVVCMHVVCGYSPSRTRYVCMGTWVHTSRCTYK